MKTALITGASNGIGLELARLFATDKINVILVARSKDKLSRIASDFEQQYGIKALPVSADLSRPGSSHALFEKIRENNHMDVEYLVNNAGFGICDTINDTNIEKTSAMLQLNMVSLAELTMLFLPVMKKKRSGRILNIGSTAGYVMPHGHEVAYAATKSFVVSFSEGLHFELKGTGVSCTHLSPGPTQSSFFDTAGAKSDARLRNMLMDTAEVAEKGYRAMMAGKKHTIPGISNKLLAFLASRVCPSRKLVYSLSGAFVK